MPERDPIELGVCGSERVAMVWRVMLERRWVRVMMMLWKVRTREREAEMRCERMAIMWKRRKAVHETVKAAGLMVKAFTEWSEGAREAAIQVHRRARDVVFKAWRQGTRARSMEMRALMWRRSLLEGKMGEMMVVMFTEWRDGARARTGRGTLQEETPVAYLIEWRWRSQTQREGRVRAMMALVWMQHRIRRSAARLRYAIFTGWRERSRLQWVELHAHGTALLWMQHRAQQMAIRQWKRFYSSSLQQGLVGVLGRMDALLTFFSH